MRSTRLLASPSRLAAALGTAGIATAAAARGRPAGRRPASPAPLEALASHPGAARGRRRPGVRGHRPVVDGDGTTHVRLDRTYRGLPVLGGDLVVHQAPGGSLEGRQPDPDGAAHARRPPRRSARPPPARTALAPSEGHPLHRRACAPTGTPQLVVDALGRRPRLAWEVMSGGTPGRRHPEPPGDVRRRRAPARCSAREQEIQTVDGSGQSLYSGTVPLQRDPVRQRRTSSRTVPAAAPTPPT